MGACKSTPAEKTKEPRGRDEPSNPNVTPNPPKTATVAPPSPHSPATATKESGRTASPPIPSLPQKQKVAHAPTPLSLKPEEPPAAISVGQARSLRPYPADPLSRVTPQEENPTGILGAKDRMALEKYLKSYTIFYPHEVPCPHGHRRFPVGHSMIPVPEEPDAEGQFLFPSPWRCISGHHCVGDMGTVDQPTGRNRSRYYCVDCAGRKPDVIMCALCRDTFLRKARCKQGHALRHIRGSKTDSWVCSGKREGCLALSVDKHPDTDFLECHTCHAKHIDECYCNVCAQLLFSPAGAVDSAVDRETSMNPASPGHTEQLDHDFQRPANFKKHGSIRDDKGEVSSVPTYEHRPEIVEWAVSMLKSTTFARDLQPKELLKLIPLLHEEVFDKETTVFKIGDAVDVNSKCYFVHKGSVRVVHRSMATVHDMTLAQFRSLYKANARMPQTSDELFEHFLENRNVLVVERDEGEVKVCTDRLRAWLPATCLTLHPTPTETITNVIGNNIVGASALMGISARDTTAEAAPGTVVYSLEHGHKNFVVKKVHRERRAAYLKYIETISWLKSLKREQKEQLADALVPQEYAADEYVIVRGEETNYIYLIMEGQIDVHESARENWVSNPEAKAKSLICSFGPGQIIGELEFLFGEAHEDLRKAQAYCVAGTSMTLAKLSSKHFDSMFGLKEILLAARDSSKVVGGLEIDSIREPEKFRSYENKFQHITGKPISRWLQEQEERSHKV